MRRRSHGSEGVGAAGADARGRIVAAIAAKPGIHMRELERIVGISLSGISHHLRVLENQGTVIGISDRHYRPDFLSRFNNPQRGAPPPPAREVASGAVPGPPPVPDDQNPQVITTALPVRDFY